LQFFVIVIIVIVSDMPYTVGITLITMVTIVTRLCLLCAVTVFTTIPFFFLQLRQTAEFELQAEAAVTVEHRTCNTAWHSQIAALRRIKLKREFVYA
jgi:hypothetical protein